MENKNIPFKLYLKNNNIISRIRILKFFRRFTITSLIAMFFLMVTGVLFTIRAQSEFKVQETIKYLWASTDSTWVGFHKWEKEYNNQGVLSDSIMYSKWRGADWGMPAKRIHYTYNDKGKMTGIFTQNSIPNDTTDGFEWKTETQWLYFYNTDGKRDSATYSSRSSNIDMRLKTIEKLTYHYNSDMELITKTHRIRPDSSWFTLEKIAYTYTRNGQVASETHMDKDRESDPLLKDYKFSFTYNETGKVSQKISYNWKDNQWNQSGKKTYGYEQGVLSQKSSFYWENGEWQPNNRVTLTFDQGRKSQKTFQEWKQDAWQNSERKIWLYTDSGVTDTVRTYRWNSDSLQWGREGRVLYDYNAHNKVRLKIKQFWRDSAGVWKNTQKWEYTYVQTATGIEETKAHEIPTTLTLKQNYPNPFNPATTIQYSLPAAQHVTLTIYNTLGRKVQTLIDEKKSKGGHRVRWNASRLSSGVYLYRLQTESGQKTKSMLLLK